MSLDFEDRIGATGARNDGRPSPGKSDRGNLVSYEV